MAKQQFPWLNKQETFTENVQGVRVTFKKPSFGAQRRIQGEVTKVDAKGKVDMDASLMMVSLAVESIVDWDFTDENENKLPIEIHTFDEVFDPEFAAEIIKVVTDKVAGDVSDKKKKK
ncbi:hypothetical protein OCA16_25840 [Bacillus cereus]|nr:hypothetical protein [Bacillus cereus]